MLVDKLPMKLCGILGIFISTNLEILPVLGVITDELNAYNGLATLGYTHAVVNHSAEEYADGDIFTNSIEGFWSHFRRMISGCYHDVSDEHLQQYIDEAVYRWNTRKMNESERFVHMFDKSIGLVRKWSEIKVSLTA